MSNYTQIILYGPKDSLTHGDPNKALKGVQLDAEFGAIATAISSKQDSSLQNIAVTGTPNVNALTVTGSATAGQSFGVGIAAGTTSGDYSLSANSKAGTVLLQVRGDGRLLAGTFDFTPTTGSFAVTYGGGMSGGGTWNYVKMGGMVDLYLTSPSLTTSTTGTWSVSTLPAAIQPVRNTACAALTFFNGGIYASSYFTITTGGVITVGATNTTGGVITGAANSGFPTGVIARYSVL